MLSRLCACTCKGLLQYSSYLCLSQTSIPSTRHSLSTFVVKNLQTNRLHTTRLAPHHALHDVHQHMSRCYAYISTGMSRGHAQILCTSPRAIRSRGKPMKASPIHTMLRQTNLGQNRVPGHRWMVVPHTVSYTAQDNTHPTQLIHPVSP